MPPKIVAILEDHAGRAAAMRLALAKFLPELNVIVFVDAREMIRWLDRILGYTALISLDHDLLPCDPPAANGRRPDPGTGRDVADYLAGVPCVCPVIVHTSNTHAAPGMMRVLREAGWVCSAVTPGDDLRWIREWMQEVALYQSRGWLF